MGILIQYEGRETTFWYTCSREQVRDVIRSHAANWRTELVDVEGGSPVARPLPPFTARYVTRWDGDTVGESEKVDVAAIIA